MTRGRESRLKARYEGDCPRCGLPCPPKERRCPVCADCRATMSMLEISAWRKPEPVAA